MPWARLDDRFPTNRKVALLSDAAFRLYVTAICWSTENLTDGVIRTKELRVVANVRAAGRRAQELVDAGLWEQTPDGWVIHDFAEYQPTAEQVREDRAAAAARQKRWRDKKKGTPPGPPRGDASGTGAPAAPDPGPAPAAGDRRVPNAPIDEDGGFRLTDAMRRWATNTVPNVDIEHSTRQFVSHYRATGTSRRSWPDAWQKWLRDDAQRGAGRPVQGAFLTPIPGGAAPRRSTTDDRVQQAIEAGRRRQRLADEQADQNKEIS